MRDVKFSWQAFCCNATDRRRGALLFEDGADPRLPAYAVLLIFLDPGRSYTLTRA